MSINGKRSKKDHRTADRMIHGNRQVSEPSKEHHTPAGMHWGPPPTLHTKRRGVRWSARRKRDAWMVLVVLLLGVGIIVTLSSGSLQGWAQVRVARPGTSPATGTQARPTGGLAVPAATVTVRTAQVRIYPFPSSN